MTDSLYVKKNILVYLLHQEVVINLQNDFPYAFVFKIYNLFFEPNISLMQSNISDFPFTPN